MVIHITICALYASSILIPALEKGKYNLILFLILPKNTKFINFTIYKYTKKMNFYTKILNFYYFLREIPYFFMGAGGNFSI